MAAHHQSFARACALAAVLLLAAGCVGQSSSQVIQGSVVHVTERDFHIGLRPAVTSAGAVTLVDHNQGPDTHELIIVRAAGQLPFRSDDITVNEDALKPRTLGQLPGLAPGATSTLVLHLRPGRYEIFCNMLGHYEGGMHAELIVR
jgi:uncharacterized cupredoxin-like copper-binding protein